MLLIFSLVAISFVWTSGQRLDAWVFLTFNLRWSRPHWLDQVMLGFTQIGNGFATLAIAVVLLLASELILAYELILGTLTLWLLVTLVKLTGPAIPAFYPVNPGAHRWNPGTWAFFPQRAYQPIFFHRNPDDPAFSRQLWSCPFAICHRPNSRHYPHVCGGSLSP